MLSARSGKWLPIPLVQREWDTGPLVRNPEVEVVRAHLTAPIRVRLTGSAGWRGVAQRVAVRPWSKYIIRLTGDWSNANAYIGAHGIADVNVVNTNIDSVTPERVNAFETRST